MTEIESQTSVLIQKRFFEGNSIRFHHENIPKMTFTSPIKPNSALDVLCQIPFQAWLQNFNRDRLIYTIQPTNTPDLEYLHSIRYVSLAMMATYNLFAAENAPSDLIRFTKLAGRYKDYHNVHRSHPEIALANLYNKNDFEEAIKDVSNFRLKQTLITNAEAMARFQKMCLEIKLALLDDNLSAKDFHDMRKNPLRTINFAYRLDYAQSGDENIRAMIQAINTADHKLGKIQDQNVINQQIGLETPPIIIPKKIRKFLLHLSKQQ